MNISAYEMLLTPKGPIFWSVTAIAALITIAIYLVNATNRDAIEKGFQSFSKGRPTLGMRDICNTADLGGALSNKTLVVPERLWCYDEKYIDIFVRRASELKTTFGDTVLIRYLKPTLFWNDIIFAVALATFTALAAIGIGSLLPWQPWAGYLMLFCSAMGVIYGISDIAEDSKLFSMMDKGPPIEADDAATVNSLTRIKLVSLTLSGIGGVAFILLQLLAKAVKAFG